MPYMRSTCVDMRNWALSQCSFSQQGSPSLPIQSWSRRPSHPEDDPLLFPHSLCLISHHVLSILIARHLSNGSTPLSHCPRPVELSPALTWNMRFLTGELVSLTNPHLFRFLLKMYYVSFLLLFYILLFFLLSLSSPSFPIPSRTIQS